MHQRRNNELKNRIGSLGIGQSVLATRPSHTPGLRLVGYTAAAAAFVLGALFWFAAHHARPLAQVLPAETPFYASANLDLGSHWYDRIFFWKRGALPEHPVPELIARIDALAWASATAKEVLAFFSGSLEFAELASGELVLAGTLAEGEKWAAVSGISKPREGEIYPGFGPAGGLWARKSPDWVWFMRDNRLYIATSGSVASELLAKPAVSVAQTLSAVPSRGSLGTILVSRGNQSAITRHPAVRFLLQGADLPGVLDFYYSPGKITFSSQGATQKSSATDLSSASVGPMHELYRRFSGDAAVYAADAGSLHNEWISGATGILQEDIRSVQELLGAFYHTDSLSLLSALGGSEFVFLLRAPDKGAPSEPSWLVLANEEVPEELIIPVAETLFAATHPLAQEIPLADGTNMVELRADIEGILWERVLVPYEDREFPFKELRGAGELHGLATGVISGLGRVLTNDVSLLSDTFASTDIDPCFPSGHSTGGARLSGSFLSTIYPALWSVKRITITDFQESGISGCVQLADE